MVGRPRNSFGKQKAEVVSRVRDCRLFHRFLAYSFFLKYQRIPAATGVARNPRW
jgi:hypothetical protein